VEKENMIWKHYRSEWKSVLRLVMEYIENWVVYMYDDIVNNNKKEFTVS